MTLSRIRHPTYKFCVFESSMRRWKLSIKIHEMIKVPYQDTRRDSKVLARDAGSRQKVIIGITELSGNLGRNDKNKDLFWGPSCM